jgi:diketogulonate reductase-like aldo/keto reductase
MVLAKMCELTFSSLGNEEQVGKAIRESGIPREEFFVTTKLPYVQCACGL